MSGRSKSASKPSKTQVATTVTTPSPSDGEGVEEELKILRSLQKTVIVRYSIYFGRKHLMSLKMRELQPELQQLRNVKKKLSALYEEAESTGRLNVAEVKRLKKIYKEVKEVYSKKAEPYDKRIRPLTRNLKYIDEVIVRNHPAVKPHISEIYDENDIPEEFRIPKGGK